MIQITIGFILDLIIGDPNNPFHPVRIIGKLASHLENIFRKLFKNYLKIAGFFVWLITIAITLTVTYILVYMSYKINIYLGTILEGILIYFCISGKGLVVEGIKVINYLVKDDIEKARHQLSYIVGRDTTNLDKEGIVRAVIETIAENMSDGVIAPLFYAGIFGAPLAMTYKAVNTMDSMFGYKNDKYISFGYFPAKLDDVFNYIPARLTGFFIVITSFILKYDYKNSYKIYKRDRYNHTSPNSAHPESAMAGALDIQLGGPNYYFGKLVVKPTIGDKIKEVQIEDVKRTSKILYLSSFMGYLLSILTSLILQCMVI